MSKTSYTKKDRRPKSVKSRSSNIRRNYRRVYKRNSGQPQKGITYPTLQSAILSSIVPIKKFDFCINNNIPFETELIQLHNVVKMCQVMFNYLKMAKAEFLEYDIWRGTESPMELFRFLYQQIKSRAVYSESVIVGFVDIKRMDKIFQIIEDVSPIECEVTHMTTLPINHLEHYRLTDKKLYEALSKMYGWLINEFGLPCFDEDEWYRQGLIDDMENMDIEGDDSVHLEYKIKFLILDQYYTDWKKSPILNQLDHLKSQQHSYQDFINAVKLFNQQSHEYFKAAAKLCQFIADNISSAYSLHSFDNPYGIKKEDDDGLQNGPPEFLRIIWQHENDFAETLRTEYVLSEWDSFGYANPFTVQGNILEREDIKAKANYIIELKSLLEKLQAGCYDLPETVKKQKIDVDNIKQRINQRKFDPEMDSDSLKNHARIIYDEILSTTTKGLYFG